MAITKIRIWAQLVSGLTVAPKAFIQCGSASDWIVRSPGLMEKIMRPFSQNRALQDDELEQATGGNSVSAVLNGIGSALNRAARDSGGGPETVAIWGIEFPLPPPK